MSDVLGCPLIGDPFGRGNGRGAHGLVGCQAWGGVGPMLAPVPARVGVGDALRGPGGPVERGEVMRSCVIFEAIIHRNQYLQGQLTGEGLRAIDEGQLSLSMSTSETEESRCSCSVSEEDGDEGIAWLITSAPKGSAKYNTGFTSATLGFTSARLFMQLSMESTDNQRAHTQINH